MLSVVSLYVYFDIVKGDGVGRGASDFGFQFSRFECRVADLGVQVSGSGFRVGWFQRSALCKGFSLVRCSGISGFWFKGISGSWS